MPKVRPGDRLRFLSGRLFSGESEETISITGKKTSIKRGDRLRAKLEIGAVSDNQSIHAVRVEVSGQREEAEVPVRLRSEILQHSEVPEGYILNIPVLFRVPEAAAFTQHGADWRLHVSLIEDEDTSFTSVLEFCVIPG